MVLSAAEPAVNVPQHHSNERHSLTMYSAKRTWPESVHRLMSWSMTDHSKGSVSISRSNAISCTVDNIYLCSTL